MWKIFHRLSPVIPLVPWLAYPVKHTNTGPRYLTRHLNRDQKRVLIREQLRETPENSDRQIAEGLGVDKNTVAARRREMEAGGEIHHLSTSTGADGKQYPRKPVSVFNPTRREMKAIQAAGTVERMAETGERKNKQSFPTPKKPCRQQGRRLYNPQPFL